MCGIQHIAAVMQGSAESEAIASYGFYPCTRHELSAEVLDMRIHKPVGSLPAVIEALLYYLLPGQHDTGLGGEEVEDFPFRCSQMQIIPIKRYGMLLRIDLEYLIPACIQALLWK